MMRLFALQLPPIKSQAKIFSGYDENFAASTVSIIRRQAE